MALIITGFCLGFLAGTETGRVITLAMLKPLPRPWRGIIRAWRYLDPLGLPRDIRRMVTTPRPPVVLAREAGGRGCAVSRETAR